MRLRIKAVVLLLLLTSCASGESANPRASEQPGAASTASESPAAAATPSERPASQQPAEGESLTGVLGADAVEGGCAYLEAADGTRYEVLYPDGWTLQLSPLQLIDPDGAVHARPGDPVTVRGGTARDMASICQIGPIFQATDVVSR